MLAGIFIVRFIEAEEVNSINRVELETNSWIIRIVRIFLYALELPVLIPDLLKITSTIF